MMKWFRIFAIACVIFSLCAAGGYYGASRALNNFGGYYGGWKISGPKLVQNSAGVLGSGDSSSPVIASIRKVAPAVVNIDTKAQRSFDPFDGFFGGFGGLFGGSVTEEVPAGQGSGVIIDSKTGLVLTNHHVIDRATKISLSLPDKRTFDAKVLGSDAWSDIALLKIEGSNLPQARVSQAEIPPIGSWVVAIGNPFGFKNSVTVGVLSATGRILKSRSGTTLQNMLQTDTAINPGNSGGPLCNLNGEIIGLNTAIISEAQGLGFATPASTIRWVVAEILDHGRVRRPWPGFFVRDLHPRVAQRLNLPFSKGALVVRVVQDSPAVEATIEAGDVILQLDDRVIEDSDDVVGAFMFSKVGGIMKVTVWRDGKRLTLNLPLRESKAEM